MSVETLDQTNRNSIIENLLKLKQQILGKGKEKENKENHPQETKEKKYDNEPKIIPSTREYKIYKLGLGSTVTIKGDIQKAMVKITDNQELSKYLTSKDIEFESIIPTIIKESLMDNNARSSTGAVGYFQLKQAAVNDVIKEYQLQKLNLDYKNPVDNIIIGVLYKKILQKRLNKGLNNLSNLSSSDLEKLRILSYNAGDSRIKSLFNESNSKNYKEFERYLAKKIGVREAPIKKKDKDYRVEYMDPLPNLNIKNLNKDDEKIAEGLRYVAIIDGISSYIKSNEKMEIIGKITTTKDVSLFSAVKNLRDQGMFKENAPINEICKIILESNGYGEKGTPEGAELLIIKDALIDYLP